MPNSKRFPWWKFPLLLLLAHTSWSAEPSVQPQVDSESAGVPLRLLNRQIFNFRAAFGPYQPSQRAAAALALIEEARPTAGGPRVSSQVTGTNIEIRVYGQAVFYVTPNDVVEIQGESLESLADITLRRLDLALSEKEEFGDHRGLLIAGAKAIAGTLLLVVLIWAMFRNRRWLEGRLIRATADKADQLKSHTLRILGLQNVVPLLRGLMTTVAWSIILAATYIWLEQLLLLFPYTRVFGEELDYRFFHLLGTLAQSGLHALPNLGVVLLVWFAARFASSAVRRFFATVIRGQIKSRIFDPSTAPITQRLCTILIWITAIIVAFPYIPGSQTPAFRGISVLTGLMISIGSASVVAQLVGGLILVYNRTCRVGDYVRIGEHEGTLRNIGFFSSRVVTPLNEEVVIPNTQISSGALINYSRFDDAGGVILPIKVSIGYNSPWRQVHALLQEAARRTSGVKREPAPAVLQKALGDFYVEYQLTPCSNSLPSAPASCRSSMRTFKTSSTNSECKSCRRTTRPTRAGPWWFPRRSGTSLQRRSLSEPGLPRTVTGSGR